MYTRTPKNCSDYLNNFIIWPNRLSRCENLQLAMITRVNIIRKILTKKLNLEKNQRFMIIWSGSQLYLCQSNVSANIVADINNISIRTKNKTESIHTGEKVYFREYFFLHHWSWNTYKWAISKNIFFKTTFHFVAHPESLDEPHST